MDHLRREYRGDVYAGLLQKLPICRGLAIGKLAHREVGVLVLLDVPLKFSILHKVPDRAHSAR